MNLVDIAPLRYLMCIHGMRSLTPPLWRGAGDQCHEGAALRQKSSSLYRVRQRVWSLSQTGTAFRRGNQVPQLSNRARAGQFRAYLRIFIFISTLIDIIAS
jgi:hypothetical protein